jgi:hypothetical protein
MNVPGRYFRANPITGNGADRSKRPYFVAARKTDEPIVTEPYLSSVRSELC